ARTTKALRSACGSGRARAADASTAPGRARARHDAPGLPANLRSAPAPAAKAALLRATRHLPSARTAWRAQYRRAWSNPHLGRRTELARRADAARRSALPHTAAATPRHAWHRRRRAPGSRAMERWPVHRTPANGRVARAGA